MKKKRKIRQTPLIQKACATINQYRMLKKQDHILVGLSGGPDSVALLLLLLDLQREFQLTMGIAHINHCLRGEESDRDEAFVRCLARQHRIPLHLCKTDVPALARAEKLSFEEAARNVRYAFYGEIAQKYGYCSTALGHNCDDNAEQVLMNLLRGSGTKGLAGIPPVRPIHWEAPGNPKEPKDLKELKQLEKSKKSEEPKELQNSQYYRHMETQRIIRPLMEISRQEIMAYLTLKQQPFVLDSSNADNTYLRNRIRNTLIPHLRDSYNPSVTESLNRLSRIIMDEESWMAQETEKIFRSALVEPFPVKATHKERKSIEKKNVKKIMSRQVLQTVNLTEGKIHEIHLDRNTFANIHPALAKRLVRRAIEAVKGDLKRISMVHIQDILNLIPATTGGRILDLPGRIRMIKGSESICFRKESRPLRELGNRTDMI